MDEGRMGRYVVVAAPVDEERVERVIRESEMSTSSAVSAIAGGSFE